MRSSMAADCRRWRRSRPPLGFPLISPLDLLIQDSHNPPHTTPPKKRPFSTQWRQPMPKTASSLLTLAVLACAATLATAADQPVIGLITKTDTNPFFVKMKE